MCFFPYCRILENDQLAMGLERMNESLTDELGDSLSPLAADHRSGADVGRRPFVVTCQRLKNL